MPEILAQIQEGDELHYMALVLTPQGIEDGGVETGLVIGRAGLSPLVTSKSHLRRPSLYRHIGLSPLFEGCIASALMSVSNEKNP